MLPKLVQALLIQTSVLLVKGQQDCVRPLPTILSSPKAEVFPAPRWHDDWEEPVIFESFCWFSYSDLMYITVLQGKIIVMKYLHIAFYSKQLFSF